LYPQTEQSLGATSSVCSLAHLRPCDTVPNT
jgi:hypothetical protein